MVSNCIIGIDFDNTIIRYDRLLHKLAFEQNLISKDCIADKTIIRDLVRDLSAGEIKWQCLQALIYGTQILQAEPFKGIVKFLKKCKSNKIKTFIISHKTKFAAQDKQGVNLHEAALGWLIQNNFIGKNSQESFFSTSDVYFEVTRQQKINRIKNLQCTHFIDDLPEVLNDPNFPKSTIKIHFSSQPNTELNGITASTWKEIIDVFF